MRDPGLAVRLLQAAQRTLQMTSTSATEPNRIRYGFTSGFGSGIPSRPARLLQAAQLYLLVELQLRPRNPIRSAKGLAFRVRDPFSALRRLQAAQ